MKAIIKFKRFSAFTKFLLFSISLGLVVSISTFSLIPMLVSATFSPGATLDPNCLPTDPTCTVSSSGVTSSSATSSVVYSFRDLSNTVGTEIRQSTSTLRNTFVGLNSGLKNTTGSSNSALGVDSLKENTTGYANSSMGDYSLSSNISGSNNIANGMQALYRNTTGSYNIALGPASMFYNTTGSGNTSIGANSLVQNVDGSNNTVFGYGAGTSLTSGSNNILIGANVNATSSNSSDFLNIGNTIYGDLASGYIGIGKNNPSSSLDVEGSGIFSGSISALNFTGTSTGVNTGDITLANNINGLTLSGQTLTLGLAGTSATGTLSATDWNTFNNKQAGSASLTSLAGLTWSSGSPLVKMTAAGTFALDTSNYVVNPMNAVGQLIIGGTAGAPAQLSAGLAGQVLRGAGTGVAPAWSTATFPDTTTANQILYSTASNTVGGSAGLTYDPSGVGTLTVGASSTEYLSVLSNGYVGIGTSSPIHLITLTGGAYSDGSTWTDASSRDLKENFVALDKNDILSKIASLDITRWNYKIEDPLVTHIGPVAEDFYEKFTVGSNNKSIAALDTAGIALLGIQAVNQNYNVLNQNFVSIFGNSNIADFASSTGDMKSYKVTDFFVVMVKKAIDQISTIFIPEVKTSRLCVGETCLSEDEIKAILDYSHVNSNKDDDDDNNDDDNNDNNSSSTDQGTGTTTATSTNDGTSTSTDQTSTSTATTTLSCTSPQVPNEAGDACVDPSPEPLTCESPKVLNDAGDACVDPTPEPLSCTSPQVPNEAGDACVDPEPEPLTCDLPEVLNDAGDTCITPEPESPSCGETEKLNDAGDACIPL